MIANKAHGGSFGATCRSHKVGSIVCGASLNAENQLEQVYGTVIPDVNLGMGKVTIKCIRDLFVSRPAVAVFSSHKKADGNVCGVAIGNGQYGPSSGLPRMPIWKLSFASKFYRNPTLRLRPVPIELI